MKPQIEKVTHNYTSDKDVCCLLDYYPTTDSFNQFNYTSMEFATNIARTPVTVGMWKIKSLKN